MNVVDEHLHLNLDTQDDLAALQGAISSLC